MHFSISSLEGISYIISNMISSKMLLSPLAPVFLSMAFFAIPNNAPSSNSSSTPSIANNSLYCFTRAFFGSVNIFTKDSSSNSSKVTMTGSLPTNSGISPYLRRSSGCRCFSNSPILISFFDVTSAPNPIDFLPTRFSIILSNPSKAPPTMNRILVVSTCINSWCGCFLPP